MTASMARIILASASPRRFELLVPLGLDIVVRPADIDESVIDGEDPLEYVRRLSIEKAAVVAATADADDLVIAADTTVVVDDQILGKPEDADDARSMLRQLSGETHEVHTGVTLRLGPRRISTVETTFVTFARLTEAEIDWYVGLGEPFGKAGAYAIQGAGGVFVRSVEGSVSNVIGLPLAEVIYIARSMGIELLR